jgi:hypothetical protein
MDLIPSILEPQRMLTMSMTGRNIPIHLLKALRTGPYFPRDIPVLVVEGQSFLH